MHATSIADNPLKIAPIALGTANYGTHTTENVAFSIMDYYYENGGNCFDTALIYGAWEPGKEGASEAVLGKWIQDRNLRDRCFVVTKGCHPDIQDEGTSRVTRAALAEDIEKSLHNLQISNIDLYLLHRDNPQVPVSDILQWLEAHREKGDIRAYGCSNWSAARLQEAEQIAQKSGIRGFQSNQIGWSLATMRPNPRSPTMFMNEDFYAFHQRTNMPLMTFSSQASGFFSDRYSPEKPAGENNNRPGIAKDYGSPENFRRLRLVKEWAAANNKTTNQVALAWLWTHPFPVIPIAGPNNLHQIQDTMGAIGLTLPPGLVERLNSPDVA